MFDAKTLILSNVWTDPATGCWHWTGPTVSGGNGERRGYILTRSGRVSSRRAAYVAFGCRPALNDHCVQSTCGEPLCCCPDHLVRGLRRKSKGPPKKTR